MNDTEYTFRERCFEVLNSIRSKGRRVFLCAVDGSKAADAALASALHFIKRNDFLCVFYSYSRSKDETLPLHLRSDALLEKYKVFMVSRLPERQYSFLWQEREDSDVKHALMRVANANTVHGHSVRPEFVFLGYTGRKGIKPDGPTTAGSNTDFAMRNIHTPSIIIKTECPEGSKSYLMIVDESEESKVGLEVLYTLLSPHDRLEVVHIYNDDMSEFKQPEDNARDMRSYYERDLAAHAPTTNAVFRLVMKTGMTSLASIILDTVDEVQPDFFVMAPKAKAQGSFTTVTEQMLLAVRCNIILCKA